MHLQQRFRDLLVRAAAELYEDHPDRMERPDLIPTPNTIDDADLVLFFEGLESGLIRLERGGKFNTLDRPTPSGRWSLLSRSRDGGWYNAEYLPQLAAYIELVRRLGYPPGRVLFELPQRSLQLDLAVLSDEGTVVVLGEAKRAAGMLDPFDRCRPRSVQPGSARRGDQAARGRGATARLAPVADPRPAPLARRPRCAAGVPLQLCPARARHDPVSPFGRETQADAPAGSADGAAHAALTTAKPQRGANEWPPGPSLASGNLRMTPSSRGVYANACSERRARHHPASATVPVNSFSKATWSGDSDNGDRSLSGNTRAASTSDLRKLVAIPILTPRSRNTASSLAISNR